MAGVIQNRDALLARDEGGRRALALDLLEAGLAAADPARATDRALDALAAEGVALEGATVIAFGKAAVPMAQAAEARIRPRRGVVVGLESARFGHLEFIGAAHPSPDEGSLAAGARLAVLTEEVAADEVVLVLVSGGGSAMVELPREGIALEVIRELAEALMLRGAPIDDLNVVRAALSAIKGGGLAGRLAHARVANVILSDVPGHPPEVVASGPTLPARSGAKAWEVLLKHGLAGQVAPDVRAILEAWTPPVLDMTRIHTVVGADNTLARDAMRDAARARGLRATEYPRPLRGEARTTGAHFLRASVRQPVDVVVGGGETTVTVTGRGRGGRNQEFALGAAELVGDGLLACLGTDGIDGSSPAAGALVDDAVLERAERRGLSIARALEENDSHSFFAAAGGSLVTGRTGTNVADLVVYVR